MLWYERFWPTGFTKTRSRNRETKTSTITKRLGNRRTDQKTANTFYTKRKDVKLTAQILERKVFDLGIEDRAIHDCIRTRSGNLQLKCNKKEDAHI